MLTLTVSRIPFMAQSYECDWLVSVLIQQPLTKAAHSYAFDDLGDGPIRTTLAEQMGVGYARSEARIIHSMKLC